MPKFDAIPDTLQFDAVPDAEPFDAIPDTIDPVAEGQKASMGALQALDVMAAPRSLDWSDVNEQLDKDRFYESESLRAQAQLDPQRAPELLAQSENLRNAITPYTTTGQQVLRSREAENIGRMQAANTEAKDFSEPYLMKSVLGNVATAQLEPIADAAAQQAGPAIGGALGAASFIHPGVGAFRAAIPLIAGYGGAIMGGAAQEMTLRAAETEEETQARLERWSAQQQANPGASLIGGMAANLPLFGISPSNLGKALQGNRAALTNVGASAGIGGGAEAISQILQSRPLDMQAIAMSAIGNALMSEPTALGRRLGFPGSPVDVADMLTTPKGPSREVLRGSPRVESIRDISRSSESLTSVMEMPLLENAETRYKDIISERESSFRGGASEAEGNRIEKEAAGLVEPSGIGMEAITGINPETQRLAPEEVIGKTKEGGEIQGGLLLAGDDVGGVSLRAPSIGGEITRSEAVEIGARTPQEPQRSGQPIGESSGNVPEGTSINTPSAAQQMGERSRSLLGMPADLSTAPGERIVQSVHPTQEAQVATLSAEGLPPTSNKEAVVNAERAARGLDPVIKEARISNPASMEIAESAIDQNPRLPQEIVARLRTNPQDRSISVKDSAVLLLERTRLNNERNQALQRASDESLEPFERAAAQDQFKDIEGQLNNLDQAAQDARSTWGRFGQLWQRSMNSDYSLEALPARARVAKGEPLTVEESQRVADISGDVEAAQKTEAKILEDRSPENVAVDNVIQNTPVDPAVKSIADRIIARMDVAAANAAKSLRSRLGNLGSAPDPLIILDVARIAAAKTAKGAIQFAQWSAEMIKEFGEKVRPFLQAGWDQREQHIDAAVNTLGGAKKKEAKARITKTPTEQLARIDTAIGNRIKEGAELKTLGPYVRKLAEQFVKSGINEREALIDAVHGALQSKVEITREQARDLISGYGESTLLSKDPNKVVLRDLKGQMQQIAKLESLAKKVPLKKTGPERRTPSAEERKLIKEVNEAKKKFGVVVTDPETQLKSTLDSVRSRLRNEIEDLSLEIETGERPPDKTPIEYTQDIEVLKGIRDRVRETLKEIEGPKQITDEQRIAASKRGLESAISALERRIGGEQPKAKKNVTTPEIEALKAKRDSLSAQLEEVEASDAVLQEERKAESLVRAIEKSEKDLASNATKAAVHGADTQLVAEAKQQLQTLRDQISKRRESDPQKQAEAIEKAEQALEKNIKKLSDQMEAGDIDVKSRKPGPQSQRLEYLRAQRDALTKLRTHLRNEARPRLTAEQAAIKARKAHLARREAELLDRIAKEDFGPRPRKEPINPESDPDLLDAQVRTNEAKAKFEKLKEEWRIRNLTGTQRVIRGIKQTWDASRNLWLSMDLSAPLQTAFAMAAHPIEGVKAIGKGFRVFGGVATGMDRYAKRVEQQIRNSPNNKSGLYRRMKLDMSDVTGDVREENMGSVLERLADLETRWQDLPDAVKGLYGLAGKKLVKGATTIAKLPLKALGMGLKASNAGFGAIANHMRARTADAILARSVKRRGEGSLNNDFLELIGNQVNAATGKGGLQGESGLRSLLFAPNYYLSILKQLSAQPLGKAIAHHNRAAIREIGEEYIRATLTAASILGLAYLFGDRKKFTLDPRSKDFGKAVTEKGTTIDVTMGRGAYATLAAQWLRGERVDAKGKVHPQERLAAFLNFMRGRLSREITTASTTMFGKDFRGRDKAMKDLATEMVIPLSWREFDELLEKEGKTRGSFLQILNFLGINAKTSD